MLIWITRLTYLSWLIPATVTSEQCVQICTKYQRAILQTLLVLLLYYISKEHFFFSSQVYVILARSHWQKQSSSTHWLKLPPSQVLFAHYMLYFCSFRCCIPVHTDVACMVPAKLHSDLNNTLQQSIIIYLLSPQTLLTPFLPFSVLLVCVFQHILSVSFLVLLLLH